MDYESTILNRLIDTYGVVGNPRYISEIIKEFIVRGKERYPNLFTYQSDWLAHIDEFGLNPTYTVSYTGHSIYAPNTIERPVKSAILKGSTKYRDIDTGEILESFEEGRNLELVSVKMPVLSSVGKNLFDGGLEIGKIGATGINESATDRARCVNFVRLKPNTTFYIKSDSVKINRMAIYDSSKNLIRLIGTVANGYSFTMGGNEVYCRFDLQATTIDGVYVQIEESSVATVYEPHKTNILTVNDDVTLRGIGDVKDELDCLTGKVTKRIGEIVLDNNKNFNQESCDDVNYYRVSINVSDLLKGSKSINDKLPASQKVTAETTGEFVGTHLEALKIHIRVLSSRLPERSINGFKTWIQQNPITVQYQLATESIKTVDLTILDQNGQNVEQLMTFNGGTHFNTGSLEGSLIPSVSVTVETDLEETLKVCSLEGNTM